MKTSNKSQRKAPKFRPGDQVTFIESADDDTNELTGKLIKAMEKAGLDKASSRLKKIATSGVTVHTSIVYIMQGGDEEFMYGVWGPQNIVRKSERDLSPLNY